MSAPFFEAPPIGGVGEEAYVDLSYLRFAADPG